MKESYLTKAFRKTAHEGFPEQETVLNSVFEKRLGELRSEHAGASKERLRHLESQILPGIAAYETLQTVMPREKALQTVHGYVEERAYRLKKTFLRLIELLQLVRTAQKAPHVGDMKFKRSGAASAAPLRSLSGCARGCRSEYNDQSFHWLH